MSFSLASGEAIALTGRNGAGKSSLIAMLCGRLRPDGGSILLEGAGDEPALAENSHLVGHRDGLKTALTAGENLAFAQAVLGDAALAPAEALAVVGLAHAAELPVGYLSAGQRRRVALARLVLGAARPLWLLDEPTVALDVEGVATLGRVLGEHRARGGMVIASSHLDLPLDEAAELRLAA